MKESRYNLYVKNKDNIIFYNTFTESVLLIGPSSYQRFIESKLNYDNFQHTDPIVYQELCKNGFLLEEDRDEYKELCFSHKKAIFDTDTYSLTILPTLDCNLRCWYCFERHLEDSRIAPETINKIYKYAKKLADEKNCSYLKLELFGGEPLLHFEEDVYPLLKNIYDYYSVKGKKLSFLFVTNGVCLTKEVVDKMSFLDNIYMQISIDGTKEKHDKIKFLPNTKEGTFNTVLQNIRYASEALNNIKINLRINYDKETLKNINSLITDIKDFNRNKVMIHLEKVWQVKKENAKNEYLLAALNTFIKNGFCVSYSNFVRRNYSCKSDKYSQAVISYNGQVYKCTGRDFDTKMGEGQFSDDGDIIWNFNTLSKRMGVESYNNEKCNECKMLPLCWGPCGQKFLEMQNDALEKYCHLNQLELSLDDFVRYKVNNYMTKGREFENA